MGIAGVEVRLRSGQFAYFRQVAGKRSGMQPAIARPPRRLLERPGRRPAPMPSARDERQASARESAERRSDGAWTDSGMENPVRACRTITHDPDRAARPQSPLLRVSIVVAVITIAMKSLAWWITDSVGLLSDAMESFVNLASAAFALLMVTIARRPADADHPYGHHKAEYFSSRIRRPADHRGGAGHRLGGGPAAAQSAAAGPARLGPRRCRWSAPALNGVLAWAMLQSARRHRSIALEADARHLITDVWTSAGVVVGVGLVALTGWLWLDPAVAIGVALNILREGAPLMWQSSQGLMDEARRARGAGRHREDAGRSSRTRDPLRPRRRRRRSGQRRFVDLHMHMPAELDAQARGRAARPVEQALMSAVPGLRATIQLLPSDVEAHFDDGEDPL